MKIRRLNESSEYIWSEIRNDYFDEDERCTYIDAWTTPNDNEEGVVIAKVYEDGVVEYIDDRARKDRYAQEVIKETVSELLNKYESIKRRKSNFPLKEKWIDTDDDFYGIEDDEVIFCDDCGKRMKKDERGLYYCPDCEKPPKEQGYKFITKSRKSNFPLKEQYPKRRVMKIDEIRKISPYFQQTHDMSAGIMALVDVEDMGYCKDGVTRWYTFEDDEGNPAIYYKY